MKEIKSKLLSITWPIMIELILMYLLGSIDIFMLGKYSDEAVAIVGVSNQIIWMVNLMFVVITSWYSFKYSNNSWWGVYV